MRVSLWPSTAVMLARYRSPRGPLRCTPLVGSTPAGRPPSGCRRRPAGGCARPPAGAGSSTCCRAPRRNGVLLVLCLLRGLHAWPLVVPPLPCNVDAVRVVPIHGQEFDLLGLGVLEDLEGLEDQFRESHALVGGEVVAFQEAEADLDPGYRADCG